MALPTISDLVTYVNKAITGNDWNTNWQKVINWLTSGNTDIKVKNLEISSTGGISNNGTLNQNGNMVVEGNIVSNGIISANGFSGDGSGLTNLTIGAEIVYTPFCVNSGNVNSNGEGDLMKYTADSTSNLTIKFKVGDLDGTLYPDLVRTTAEGHTDTGNNIYDLDMSSYTASGTRIIYIQQETIQPTVSVIGATLYRQPKEPTGVVEGDIWLDTSKEKMTSYIRTSSQWERSLIVPLGTVTMGTLDANPVIKSCQTFQYNQNGYNLNDNSITRLDMATAIAPDLSTGVNVLNTTVQYTKTPIWIKITTMGQDMGTINTIKIGTASNAVNLTMWQQSYMGANISLSFWLPIPAKTYFQFSGNTGYVAEMTKFEIVGNSTAYNNRKLI